MSYRIIRPLPTPENIKDELVLSVEAQEKIEKDRTEIIDILSGKDNRFLLIVGPCSAWPEAPVIEYADRLAALASNAPNIKIVMRVYTQKPRTTIGWLGPASQPDPFSPPDIAEGIRASRRLMLEVLKRGLPVADEILFSNLAPYFDDILAWGAIGARSSEDQEHRLIASLLPFPIGIKNPTSGDLEIGINAILAARESHSFAYRALQVETSGNLGAHLILRGGKSGPNYDLHTLQKTILELDRHRLTETAVLVDASHGNSIDPETKTKNPLQQAEVISDIVKSRKSDPRVNTRVRGAMIESFLLTGNQDLETCQTRGGITPGLSVTDPCLGWEETERLIHSLNRSLSES